jgi:hypothetical protein
VGYLALTCIVLKRTGCGVRDLNLCYTEGICREMFHCKFVLPCNLFSPCGFSLFSTLTLNELEFGSVEKRGAQMMKCVLLISLEPQPGYFVLRHLPV